MNRASWAVLALLASAGTARAQDTEPLRLLIQADAGLWPSPPPPAPASGFARWRRIRVGDELSGHAVHVRALLEWQPQTVAGQPPATLAGGRMPFGGPIRMTEVFAGWAPHRAFEVDAGSLRVPFSRSRQMDEADLPLPERAAFIDAFTPDFRTGASVGGDLGEIQYRFAILSADRTVDQHLFDRGVIAAGRLVAEPIGPVGLRPWRRAEGDPWTDWFRFAGGLSVLYGTLAAPKTLALDPELTAQWRRFEVSAEYFLSTRLASGTSFQTSGVQGAVLEPGLTFLHGQQHLVARAEWQRAGDATTWGAGGAWTAYAPDPRWRLTMGFERRWSSVDPLSKYWLIFRLTLALD